jgi:hypothetical protein
VSGKEQTAALYDLIALAHQCWLSQIVVVEVEEGDADIVKDAIKGVVVQVCLAAWGGDYRHVASLARWGAEIVHDTVLDKERWIRGGLDRCSHWQAFCEVCELAGRIDALIDVLERDGVALARSCREDLDALPVLADWCDDSGRPAAAAEVRHLHAQVRHCRAVLAAGPRPLELWVEEEVNPDLE